MDPLCRLGARECTGRSHASRAESREENLWLAQQLAVSESNARLWQEKAHRLRGLVRELEKNHCRERAAWEKDTKEKERRWRREYEHHMQSLLQIVAHHEETQQRLKDEVEMLRKEASSIKTQRVAVVAESATQTDDEGFEAQSERCEDEIQSRVECSDSGGEDIEATGKLGSAHVASEFEFVSPEDNLSIHEQFVSLTMQKLLEQLRISNQASTSSCSAGPFPPSASSPSFRDMIYERLATNATLSEENLNEKFKQDIHASLNGSVMRSATVNHEARRIPNFSKLPVVKEEEAALPSSHIYSSAA